MPTRSITLLPGETMILPKDSNIISIVTQGGISVTSTCGTLPTPEAYSCYYMAWGYSATSGDNAALENDAGVVLDYIKVGNNTYNIGQSIVTNAATVKNIIEATVPQDTFKVYSVSKNIFTRREEFAIKFKTVASLVGTIRMQITGVSFPNGLILIPIQDSDCTCFSGQDEVVCDSAEAG